MINGLLFAAICASAEFYSFDCITNNNIDNAAIGEAQLGLTVKQSTTNDRQIVFTFSNNGSEASSICDIYFEDAKPVDLVFDHFDQSNGVEFTVGANPAKLPGGKNVSFSTAYSYDSDSPRQPNGINPGESLDIIFDYVTSQDYNTNYKSIIASLNSSDLRVGIHVQGFNRDGSESFVNSVPEPTTTALLGISLLLLGFLPKRKKR